MFKSGKLKLICWSVLMVAVVLTTASFSETKDPAEPIKTINFQAAEVRSVIRFLADYGQINVVVAPAVEGNVTIALTNVSWKEALEIIGRTYDLAIVYEESGYIRVLPAEVYRQELTDTQKHHVEQNNLIALTTKIIKVNNSTATSIVTAVKSVMSDRGKATADERTNSIVLQEIPENLAEVEGFIATLDQPPRQIRISAQLLEISSRELHEMGVNWLVNGASGSLVDDGTGSLVPEIVHQTTQTADLVASPPGQFWIKTIQDSWDLEATISALVSDGSGKIVAHPEITTIENVEARIQMGQKVPIKQFDASGNTVITFEEVGTLLRVTPHITSKNKILMHLIPERSSYEFDPNGVIINTSNAETNVVVENGQTAVIGGLTTQDEIESSYGIPVLKDLPVLGVLFGYTKKEIINRDLVIFVTPTLVEDFTASIEDETP